MGSERGMYGDRNQIVGDEGCRRSPGFLVVLEHNEIRAGSLKAKSGSKLVSAGR